jgi:hypothetical protein
MAEKLGSIGMGVVRAGAVVLALGALVFFVVRAQTNASVDAAVSGGDSRADPAGAFLPSSKSEGGLVFTDDAPRPKDAGKPVFLPSSKSLPYDEAFGRSSGLAPAPKKKPVFLPSSKSMPMPVAPRGGK